MPSALARGRKVYNERCYFCHGYEGDAKTVAATYLTPPPRDFRAADPTKLTREKMLAAVADGRPGTAMKGFAGLLSRDDMTAAVDYVRETFMHRRGTNTYYHTAENGWPDHERYETAFPFVRGEIPLDRAWEVLTPEQRKGRRLFMSACVTCHDRARGAPPGAPWETRAVSYPRGDYRHDAPPPAQADTQSGASPYARHEQAPRIDTLTAAERKGKTLFQSNCAFCHGADGTGRNWIGQFLEPPPRDLTAAANMKAMTRARLTRVIREGLPGASMPAWKNVLREDEIDAVVAYIARAFHPLAPGGDAGTPLPPPPPAWKAADHGPVRR